MENEVIFKVAFGYVDGKLSSRVFLESGSELIPVHLSGSEEDSVNLYNNLTGEGVTLEDLK